MLVAEVAPSRQHGLPLAAQHSDSRVLLVCTSVCTSITYYAVVHRGHDDL